MSGSLQNTLAVIAQCQAEGGEARFNPLNCTVTRPGSTPYNTVPVQNYASYAQGIEATASMLRQANMRPLHAALARGTSAAMYWEGLRNSPWSTRPPVGYTIPSWLGDTSAHWMARAMTPISGT